MSTADWTHGYPLDELRPITALFREADAGKVVGAFAGVNDAWVAARLHAGTLRYSDTAAVVLRQARAKTRWKVHGDRDACTILPGQWVCERFAGSVQSVLRLAGEVRPVALRSLLPSPAAADLADTWSLDYCGAQVPAGGEVVGMWAAEPASVPGPLDNRNCFAIAEVDERSLVHALAAVDLDWQQHYSTYNKRSSWTALALRGFGGDTAFIEKPAEMSKQWKAEHPGWEQIVCVDTPQRAAVEPMLSVLLDSLGIVRPERVRLMRLAAGRGELTRHADVTDREAGITPGRLARVHVPLITNPRVRFTTWRLADGLSTSTHMSEGWAWVLDHTKPHAAINAGATDRVHLVVDAPVEGRLADLILAAA